MRAPRPLAAAAAVGLALALSGCSPETAPMPTPAATAGPIAVAHTDAPLDAAVAAVIERHLRQSGHTVRPASEGGLAASRPWAGVEADVITVVDTLALTMDLAPEQLLPTVPEPTPDASSPSSPTPLPPLDPAAPPRVPEPTPTTAPASVGLPTGEPALDAEATRRLTESLIAAGAAPDGSTGAATSRLSPAASPGAASPGGATPGGAGAPGAIATADAPIRILAVSRDPLRLAAVITAPRAARYGMDSLDDLNGRCGGLTVAGPEVAEGATRAVELLRLRMERLTGCRDATWLEPGRPALPGLVRDEAQVAFAYRADPEIAASALTVLGDGTAVLPSGPLAAVGNPDALDDGAEAAVRQVMDALDEEGQRELLRLTTGPDALDPAEAAQYWLVSRGLEQAPEDWFVPRGSWF